MAFKFSFTTESELPVTDQNKGSGACTHKECLRIYVDELVMTLSCALTLLILQLPMTYIHGKPVPTFIFASQPSSFHAFLIFNMGACYGSVCSITLRERKHKAARFYNGFAVVSMAASLAVLFGAAVWAGFRSWLSLYVVCGA